MAEKDSNMTAWIKRLWAPAAGFIGAVTAIVQFIELWEGDRETVTLVAAGLGLAGLLAVLVYAGVGKQPAPDGAKKRVVRYPKYYKAARGLLAVVVLLAVGAGAWLYQQDRVRVGKFTILVAEFYSSTEDSYAVNDTLLNEMRRSVGEFEDIEVVAVGQSITEQEGSEAAQALGRKYHADLVLWGWYAVSLRGV